LTEGIRNSYRILVGKRLEKCVIGRSKRRWEDNINIQLKEVGCENGGGWNWLRIVSNDGI
jgi:hypothetical protein